MCILNYVAHQRKFGDFILMFLRHFLNKWYNTDSRSPANITYCKYQCTNISSMTSQQISVAMCCKLEYRNINNTSILIIKTKKPYKQPVYHQSSSKCITLDALPKHDDYSVIFQLFSSEIEY